ncbi:MAG: hypothetical protein AAF985_00290 [Bacteroidota bacterium]
MSKVLAQKSGLLVYYLLAYMAAILLTGGYKIYVMTATQEHYVVSTRLGAAMSLLISALFTCAILGLIIWLCFQINMVFQLNIEKTDFINAMTTLIVVLIVAEFAKSLATFCYLGEEMVSIDMFNEFGKQLAATQWYGLVTKINMAAYVLGAIVFGFELKSMVKELSLGQATMISLFILFALWIPNVDVSAYF